MGIYRKKQKPLRRHSRAGGNLGLSVRKLIGKNGFFRFYVLDSHFRGNDGRAASVAPDKCRNLKSRHSRAGGNLDIQC